MLARIYLGECALNISVGIDDECKDYLLISDLLNNTSLDAYYAFIRVKPEYSLENLASQYKDFALHLRNKDFTKAQSELQKIDKASSKLLAASLIKGELTNATRGEMIKTASFYGYKKSVLFWLSELKANTSDEDERKKISKKISVLKSSD